MAKRSSETEMAVNLDARFVTNYQPGLVFSKLQTTSYNLLLSVDLPRMVLPGSVPNELRDEVPTRDRAPPSQQPVFKPLDLSVPGQKKQTGSSRLDQLGVIQSKDEFWQELKEISRKQQKPAGKEVSNGGSST